MSNPKQYPIGRQHIPTSAVVDTLDGADQIEVIRGDSTQRAITYANFLLNASAIGLILKTQELTASGAVDSNTNVLFLNKSDGAIAATIAAPAAGRPLLIIQTDAGTSGHTVTLAAGTFDGTNPVATLDAADEALLLVGTSATRFYIITNNGSVGLSNP